ncbi:FAD-dependent thymidylate synthase [Candidatus Parcubacteria bacterium]|nr:FAD-dependent thymidylate synthase [Candidatus Parcubacteria bacterium]
MATERTSISAEVVADSFHNRSRLTTFEVVMPRFLLPEFNTHRDFSRNSASSRAIPVWKRLKEVLEKPFVPLQFGKNKAGMQSAESVSEEDNAASRHNWLVGRDVAVLQAFFLSGGTAQILKDSKGDPRAEELCKKIEDLSYFFRDVITKIKPIKIGVHKQHANRVLEPYSYHTVIVTSSVWKNFYALRASPLAQPEIQTLAIAMARAHTESVPCQLDEGGWHLPFVFDEDRKEVSDPKRLARLSSARCARVSYLTHDGKRSLDADFQMADSLQINGHMSPFEHPATILPKGLSGLWYSGNFTSCWTQYRKMLPNENDFSRMITRESLLQGLEEDETLVNFVLSLPN